MAVVVLFRVGIAVATSSVGRAALVWVASGGSTYFGSVEKGVLSALRYYEDGGTDASELQDQLNAADDPELSPGWIVTDFTDAFELRKLQWRFSRAPSGGTTEDVDVMTFHFIKATGGTPGTYVDSTDLPAVESAATTFWAAIKSWFPDWLHSDQYRWYKDGPAFYELNSGGTAYVPLAIGNPAIRVTEVDVAGTVSGEVMPPQIALTITEKTSVRKSWGRFYLPNVSATFGDADGRAESTNIDTLCNAAVTFYNACRTAHMVPVVFSIQKPERPKKPSGTLPEQDAIAYEVLSLTMDNVFDVIRSRRWGGPTYRKSVVLT